MCEMVCSCGWRLVLRLVCVHRQQIQHSTNQLAKETNKLLKELGSIPLPSSPSQQVRTTQVSLLPCQVSSSCFGVDVCSPPDIRA